MNRHGFALIEVLFVVALIAMLLAAVSPYLGAFHTSWQSADKRSEIIQNARVGMDKIAGELRQAGSFTSIQSNLIAFTDVDNNPVTYNLNAGNLERNGVILAGPVDNLVFIYYDEAGEKTTASGRVKSVKIFMRVADPEGKVDPLLFVSTAFMRSETAGPVEDGSGHFM